MSEFRTINTVNLQLRGFDAGLGKWSEYNTTSQATFGHAGMGGGAFNQECAILKFTVPKFMGIAKQVELVLLLRMGEIRNTTAHYAICTSDSNKGRYITANTVNDPNQIISGDLTLTNLGSATTSNHFDIFVSLEPNKTYYLFLWGGDHVAIENATAHSILVDYISGFVHIDNGTEFALYQCYVDNGSGWDMYIPYIDNGTSWDMYS